MCICNKTSETDAYRWFSLLTAAQICLFFEKSLFPLSKQCSASQHFLILFPCPSPAWWFGTFHTSQLASLVSCGHVNTGILVEYAVEIPMNSSKMVGGWVLCNVSCWARQSLQDKYQRVAYVPKDWYFPIANPTALRNCVCWSSYLRAHWQRSPFFA